MLGRTGCGAFWRKASGAKEWGQLLSSPGCMPSDAGLADFEMGLSYRGRNPLFLFLETGRVPARAVWAERLILFRIVPQKLFPGLRYVLGWDGKIISSTGAASPEKEE